MFILTSMGDDRYRVSFESSDNNEEFLMRYELDELDSMFLAITNWIKHL